METSSVVAVFRALDEAEARYVVAGGLAVLAHGIIEPGRPPVRNQAPFSVFPGESRSPPRRRR